MSNASGGDGGSGYDGSNGAKGGAATATLVLAGKGAVVGYSSAVGGAGGAGASYGAGGRAKATTTVTGVYVIAGSSAYGGTGATAGHAAAKTTAVGTSGYFSAYATTAPLYGLIESAAASAYGTVDGTGKAKAKAIVGGAAMPFGTAGSAVALETAAPVAASTNAVLAANPTIAASFGASPTFFSVGELGGAYDAGGTTSDTTTSSLSLVVDTSRLASLGDLLVGFYHPTAIGSGFTSLTFTLSADGSTLIDKTFTTLAAAESYFNDAAVNLGALGSGALSGSLLSLTATLSLTTDAAGSGFYFQMITGDPPGGSRTATQFSQAMAGLGGASASSLNGARHPDRKRCDARHGRTRSPRLARSAPPFLREGVCW